MLEAALALSTHQVPCCIVLQRPQLIAEMCPARDLDWAQAVASAQPVECVPVASTDPLYILYNIGHDRYSQGCRS